MRATSREFQAGTRMAKCWVGYATQSRRNESRAATLRAALFRVSTAVRPASLRDSPGRDKYRDRCPLLCKGSARCAWFVEKVEGRCFLRECTPEKKVSSAQHSSELFTCCTKIVFCSRGFHRACRGTIYNPKRFLWEAFTLDTRRQHIYLLFDLSFELGEIDDESF